MASRRLNRSQTSAQLPSSPQVTERHGEGRHMVVGVSGASGMPYARCLLRTLLDQTGYTIHLLFSPAAGDVLKRECGVALKAGKIDPATFLEIAPHDAARREAAAARLIQYSTRDIGARPASGSFLHDGMIVCPASMRTLGALSVGLTDNLLTRAADVTLKERRRLVLVPRETPLSLIHLRAMVTLAEAGAIILPAMPGFYHQPKTIDDVVQFLVMKILDQFGVPNDPGYRWNPGAADAPPET